jgi:GT2 family glycosyltransferase
VVLNYNGLDHLKYCLPSILATDYPAFTVIVVDNASSDGSADFVRQNYPQVNLIISDTNRGWSGGNNLGIGFARRCGAEYVVLANNDIRVDPRWVSAAVGVAQQDPRVGIVGFQIIEPRGDDHDAGFAQAMALWSGLRVSEAKYVDGMAMFVRTRVFDEIGMIDEGFFVYAEDNDLVLRARKAGYRVVATNVPIWHKGQGYWGRAPLRAAALQMRNNLRLSIKHDNLWGILYQIARHFAKGCLPWVSVDLRDPVARRLRPSNIVINGVLLLYALAWNLYHLPQTLRRRREDMKHIYTARSRYKPF